MFNNQVVRQIHLAFTLTLAMLAHPLLKSSSPDKIPATDWALAAISVTSCLYLFFNKYAISNRVGLSTAVDMVISAIDILCGAIAAFRALGLPLVIVALTFILYVFFGHLSLAPNAIQWKGASFGTASWHFWMQTEGVFGVPLGGVNFDDVSIRFVWRSWKKLARAIILSSLRLLQWATCAADMPKPLWWPRPHRGYQVR